MILPVLDYEGVAAIRTALEQQRDALEKATTQACGADAAFMQMVACCCEVAAEALFEVMNKADSYLGDQDADTVIDGWLRR